MESYFQRIQNKSLEDQLLDSQLIIKSLFEYNQFIILLIDTNTGNVIDANDAACRFYGYAKEELLSKNMSEINFTLKPEEIYQQMQRLLSGVTGDYVFQHRMANGELRDVEIRAVVIQGKPLIFAIVHDMTKRRKAENEIKKAYIELNQIFNSAADGMRVIDNNFNIIRMNEKLLESLGLARDEAIGKKCYDILPGAYCHTPNCPIVQIMGGESLVEYEVEKELKKGVRTPFIMKATPFHHYTGELLGIVQDFKDITERKRIEEEIKQLAYHDPLTCLPNRAYIYQQLGCRLDESREKKEKVAIMFIDLDGFKYINDTFGHSMGDDILKKLAKRLQKIVPEGGMIGRFGGDEFIFILPQLQHKAEAVEHANHIINSFQRPFFSHGHELYLSASIGISLFPDDGNDLESVIKHADISMYEAKKRGNNQYQLYNGQNENFPRRIIMEKHLRNALQNKEFQVYYQPQVDIETGKIIGVEALLRWQNADLGFVSPAEFIPLAEETGFIVPLGKWVLRTACEQNKRWIDQSYPPMRVAVNFSVRQLQQPDVVEMVEEVLRETGLCPGYLELEITESIALEKLEYNIHVLNQLREMGIKISLDDFGTGYSSLSYLKQIPIDNLKIDRTFVQNIATEENNKAIANAVINLAHNLNLRVIAEGVETEDQLEFLRQQKSDYFQGYLFCKPIPAKEIEELLQRTTDSWRKAE